MHQVKESKHSFYCIKRCFTHPKSLGQTAKTMLSKVMRHFSRKQGSTFCLFFFNRNANLKAGLTEPLPQTTGAGKQINADRHLLPPILNGQPMLKKSQLCGLHLQTDIFDQVKYCYAHNWSRERAHSCDMRPHLNQQAPA